MHFIAGNKLATALIVFLALYFLAPLWMNRAEMPPYHSQDQCLAYELDPGHDPRKIRRPNSDIKIIHLTNAGEFVDRCELTNALYELNWDRQAPESKYKVDFDENAPRLPKLALLYIHGWKHNADENDDDRKYFRKLIEELRNRHSNNTSSASMWAGTPTPEWATYSTT
jgi:hypothetical protein